MILSLCAAALAFGVDSNLPTGNFVLVEGAALKRKVDVKFTRTTMKDGKIISNEPEFRKLPVSKTLAIDAKGGFREQLFAGDVKLASPVEKWRYRTEGVATLHLTAPKGQKRTLSYSFDGKLLTLRSGRNKIEVFEKK